MLLCNAKDTGMYNQDIYSHDSLIDGLDFDSLIMELKCNYRKEDIDRQAVMEQFKTNLEIRLQDVNAMLEWCMDNIIKAAKGELEC